MWILWEENSSSERKISLGAIFIHKNERKVRENAMKIDRRRGWKIRKASKQRALYVKTTLRMNGTLQKFIDIKIHHQ